MILNISKDNLNVIERGVYYFALSNYPQPTRTELKNIVAFVRYEKSHGRQTEIVCRDHNILRIIHDTIAHPKEIEKSDLRPENQFVYHATDVKAAQKIVSGGKLLSAEKVYGKSGKALSLEKNDSLWNDPADFFEYIMFSWGDNMTGDYVVLSGDFPSDDDLQKGNFNAGVRFYFRYEDMIRHPGCVFDGYHPVKIKDEITLADYLYLCIAPEQYKTELDHFIMPDLVSKVHFLSQSRLGLSDWNNKAYRHVYESIPPRK